MTEAQKAYKKEYHKQYYQANKHKYKDRHKDPERIAYMNAFSRKRYAKLKEAVIEYYGGRCKKCGFSDSRALQLDHIANDGYKERTNNRHNKYPYARYKRILTDKTYADSLQLLCANCNWIKRAEFEQLRLKEKYKENKIT